MLTNNEIKLINSLQRKKERQKHQLFIVEGVKLVEELLRSEFTIEKIFSTVPLQSKEIDVTLITESELIQISQFSTPNQMLALVQMPKESTPNQNTTSILLEDINDPGNLGTIIRTADWFGIDQIICSNNSVDCFNPKVVSATMGSIFRSKIYYTDLKKYLADSNLPSYGALLEGKPLNEIVFPKNCNLVFGSESHGLSSDLIETIKTKATILGSGNSESLNLSIAASIFCNHYFNCQ